MNYHKVYSLADECPVCHGKTHVTQTLLHTDLIGVIRYRRCADCGEIYRTIELMEDEFLQDYEAGKMD